MTRGLSGQSSANVQKFLAGVQYRPGTPAAAKAFLAWSLRDVRA